MKKTFRLILVIFYILAVVTIATIAGLSANVGCGIGSNCSTVTDYLPGIITALVILIAGGVFVGFQIKKYKRSK